MCSYIKFPTIFLTAVHCTGVCLPACVAHAVLTPPHNVAESVSAADIGFVKLP